MQKIFFLTTFILLAILDSVNSQTKQDTTVITSKHKPVSVKELHGEVQDINSHVGLPYANIYVLHKNIGAISNEKGDFSINITGLNKTDTIRFQYIGYQTKKIIIGDLDTSSTVYLKEAIFNLAETIIFGNALDAKSIVKNVIKNKDINYKKYNLKNSTFIREQYISDIDELKLNYKRSSFTDLNRDLLSMIETKMPKYSTSYTDFLGNLYFSKNIDDSVSFKIDPIRTVSLKEKNVADIEQIQSVFENVFKNTNGEEYWKVKSGILGQKIALNGSSDTTKKDSLKENERRISDYSRRIRYRLNYSLLDNKREWEFLYSTGKYKYTLVGGIKVNGEDVYIIDFKPDNSGNFIGRMYISMKTYALIRADYEYAPDKAGIDFHLFGVGYSENIFSGSIYFERKDSSYSLKYFSQKVGSYATFNRSLALLKKRKRFLFDKTLNEIKVGVDFALDSKISIEVLVLNSEKISDKQFADFKQKQKMEIIYVDQFNDKLWQDYSIIEPTKKMRDYKKQKINYTE